MKEKTREAESSKRINKLLELCLRIADWNDRSVEEQGEYGFDSPLSKELGLGYLALSGYLREGVKEVINLQSALSDSRNKENIAKLGQESAEDFLEDIFGDRDIESINEKDKERVRAFVAEIYAEWDARIEEEKEAQQHGE